MFKRRGQKERSVSKGDVSSLTAPEVSEKRGPEQKGEALKELTEICTVTQAFSWTPVKYKQHWTQLEESPEDTCARNGHYASKT